MATIKAMIVDDLQKKNQSVNLPQGISNINDAKVREALGVLLRKVCFLLPGDNDSDNNPIGVEFAKIMLSTESKFCTENVEGNDLHAKAINKLIMKIMDERDDLRGEAYKNLRQMLVSEINNGR